jgi:hypothetical protein
VIARVFTTQTSYSPDDENAYFDAPDMLTPKYDEAHISITFTWDIERGKQLAKEWKRNATVVKIGGPALGSENNKFTPGMYTRSGITYTSRGCNNKCTYCYVWKREGKLTELPVTRGNWIQDNNFLQCSREHKDKVFKMLKNEHAICFKGGLSSRLLDNHFIENAQQLKIKELWFACDTMHDIKSLERSAKVINGKYSRKKLYCYVLIGVNMQEEEKRLKNVYDLGFMPFAQLLQDTTEKKKYSMEWKNFARKWCRPAIIKTAMMSGTIKTLEE